MDTLEYSYVTRSRLTQDRGAASRLELATSGGTTPLGFVAHPYFFTGYVDRPGQTAQALLLVSRVARTRFYTPPNMLAKILRAADPVVTSSPEGLRFESFSACCGMYARLDVEASALTATHTAAGVTNVDFNPPLRQALARLRESEPLHLMVGSDELRVTTLDTEAIEERVTLPSRWLQGLAETQTLSATTAPRLELPPGALRQFVRSLPRTSSTRTVMWATPAGPGIRLASRPAAGSVCVAGPERLRVIEPLVRYATGLRAYSAEVDARSLPSASFWVLTLPGARLTVGLSPEKSRGFSGEGAVLSAVSGLDASGDADLVSALLAFEPRIDVAELSRRAALAPDRVTSALALLSSSGQVGFDLTAGTFFHRPLPVRADALAAHHPRLQDALVLVAEGAVTTVEPGLIRVRSGETTYDVRLGEDASANRCTCPWWSKHRGTRGPCKHVLAVRIWRRQAG